MTDTQNAKYAMYNKFAIFLALFATTFSGFKRLVKEITNYTTLLGNLKALLPTDTTVTNITTSITKGKKANFDAMKAQALGMAKLALVWAKDINNPTLIGAFSVTKKSFTIAEPEAVALAESLLKLLNDNSVELLKETDITQAQIDAFDASIPKAEQGIGKAASIIGNNKTANVQIEAAFDSVDDSIATIKTLILGKYAAGLPAANTDLVVAMNNALTVIASKRYTALLIKFTDAATGKPIEDATVAIPDLNKKASSNIDGVALIPSLKPKKAHASFTHSDYETIEQVVAPEKGKTVEVVVKMVRG